MINIKSFVLKHVIKNERMTNICKNSICLLSEEDSKRITSLRFILMVLIVFIHGNLTPNDAINYYHLDFQQPLWIEMFKNFICGKISVAAVPVFFLFASYLQFSKGDEYLVVLRKKMKSVLIPYII